METVTVTGTYVGMDGEPCTGTIAFTAPCVVRDSTGKTIMSGPLIIPLDSTGSFSINLPCTDSDALNPTDYCYAVVERLDCSDCLNAYPMKLPCGTSPVDITQLMPTPCADEETP